MKNLKVPIFALEIKPPTSVKSISQAHLGQSEIIKLRFTSIPVGLDEDLANTDIFANLRQCLFHRLPSSQY